jgi:hypothetical protein
MLSVSIARADGGAALGDEFDVAVGYNGTLTGVASNADGGFVVGVIGSGNTSTCSGLCIQPYAADGTPKMPYLSFAPTGAIAPPVWAIDSHGQFVVAWAVHLSNLQSRIYQQRFAADGAGIGAPVKVHTCNGNVCDVAVAVNSSGEAVVAWFDGLSFAYYPFPGVSSFHIGTQAYAADNTVIGGTRTVVSSTCIDGNFTLCSHPELNSSDGVSVAMDDAGRYIVVWGQSGNIRGRIYSSDGAAGTSFRLPLGYQTNNPALAMNEAGDIRIAADACVDYTCSQRGVMELGYTSSSAKEGPAVLVYADGSNASGQPSIAMDQTGDFVVAWTMEDPAGNCGIVSSQPSLYAQRFAVDGIPLGSCFRVNAPTDDSVGSSKVAMGAEGNFVIAWESNGPQTTIKARRYSGP